MPVFKACDCPVSQADTQRPEGIAKEDSCCQCSALAYQAKSKA